MMTKRVSLASLMVLVVLGVSSCALFTTILDESDTGSLQSLRVGETMQIELNGNATTGYEWVRDEPASLDGSPLQAIKESDYRACNDPNIVGQGGAFVFRYRAAEPGTIVLHFEYRRPSEPDVVADTYTVTIWVH
jgi:predicted secreted protein